MTRGRIPLKQTSPLWGVWGKTKRRANVRHLPQELSANVCTGCAPVTYWHHTRYMTCSSALSLPSAAVGVSLNVSTMSVKLLSRLCAWARIFLSVCAWVRTSVCMCVCCISCRQATCPTFECHRLQLTSVSHYFSSLQAPGTPFAIHFVIFNKSHSQRRGQKCHSSSVSKPQSRSDEPSWLELPNQLTVCCHTNAHSKPQSYCTSLFLYSTELPINLPPLMKSLCLKQQNIQRL